MLHAKQHYVKSMLGESMENAPFATCFLLHYSPGMKAAVIWLHSAFNDYFMNPHEDDTCDGVKFITPAVLPTRYMANKAIWILKEYAMRPFADTDAKSAAVFYYAAFFLTHVEALGMDNKLSYNLTQHQRQIIRTALENAVANMEQDHKLHMKKNSGVLDTLVDKLLDANTRRKLLKASWQNHMANTLPHGKDR